ncbi:MAG: XRE family transcriptional regulator [Sphingobacteriales bacterium]|nr:MAG: XRE family transcriptional regulator [Sphingobacteriales bacterium]
MEKRIHHGRNIKRLREMRGMKQEAFAADLGEEWTQRKVSLLETKEEVEPEILELVAKVLNITPEAIKTMDDEGMTNIITNTFNDNSSYGQGATGWHNNGSLTINTAEKWLEALEENKKLYERLLHAEREKNDLLQKLLDKK